ncbi:hypothetical protein MASR1M101_24340 [Gemmatimonas sp.]
MTTCPRCGSRISRGRHTFHVNLGRRVIAVEGDYSRCSGECAEFYFAGGEMDAVMNRAASIAEANGA